MGTRLGSTKVQTISVRGFRSISGCHPWIFASILLGDRRFQLCDCFEWKFYERKFYCSRCGEPQQGHGNPNSKNGEQQQRRTSGSEPGCFCYSAVSSILLVRNSKEQEEKNTQH